MQMKRIAFLSYPTQIVKLLMKTSIQEIKDLSVRSKTIATKRIFIGSQVRFRKRRLPKNHKMFQECIDQLESNLSHLKSIYQLMKDSFELNESENEKIEILLAEIEIRNLQLRMVFYMVKNGTPYESYDMITL